MNKLKPNKEFNDICKQIEKMLYPMCWDKPEALKTLNETSKIRKGMFYAKRKAPEDRIAW